MAEVNPATLTTDHQKGHARRPTVFSGDRKTLEKFLRDCAIYMHANLKDLPNDDAKAQFVLSHIDGGEADAWKEYYVDTKLTQQDGSYKWPTPKELATELRANFAKEDKVEESLRRLENMKQGGRTAEEVINEFRLLKARAGIADSPLAIRMFRRTLNPSLAMKILTDPDKANTLENTRKTDGSLDKQGWFTKAIQYDQIYRDA